VILSISGCGIGIPRNRRSILSTYARDSRWDKGNRGAGRCSPMGIKKSREHPSGIMNPTFHDTPTGDSPMGIIPEG
jgi:hypothetical protein